ncbi:transglutaminase family protein [Niabella terrae]
MLYEITHTTEYQYSHQVPVCHNLARLAPRSNAVQTCHRFDLELDPLPRVLESYSDFFGNQVHYFVIEQEHQQLRVTARSQVQTGPAPWRSGGISQQPWELARDRISTGEGFAATAPPAAPEIRQFAFATPVTAATEAIRAYAAASFTSGRSLYEAAMDLTRRIYRDFKYSAGFTTISTPLTVVMEEKKGVCQDFAHLAIACFQSVGLAARYVSGYLETLPPPGQPKLTGADASHAWCAVYIPEMGWVDLDPTNNKHPDESYLTIGWGRNYFDVVPLRGIIQSSGRHRLQVAVDVRRCS